MNPNAFLSRAPRRQQQDGVAIILILAFLVLLTGLVFAFFSRAITERQVANSSLNESKADILGRSAVDIIIGDFKQEIVDGSTSPAPIPAAGITLYPPKSPANMLPQTSGTPAPSPNPIPNLIRRSVRSDPLAQATPAAPGSKAVTTSASAVNSTTDPSANNRSVTPARWNSHYLIPRDPNLYAGNTIIGTDPIANFTPPDWVMVTTNGPVVLASPKKDANGNDVTPIGRYAYAVYDEGGLLDVNAAGYPQPSPTPTGAPLTAYKNSLAFADLTQLPTQPSPSNSTLPQAQVDNIVGWRNYATTHPGGTFGSYTFDANAAKRYYDFLVSNSGFLTVNPQPFPSPATAASRTDQMFTSRQALLKFRRAIGFSQNALQYLGTFSRDVDAPIWSPQTPTGCTDYYDYAAKKDAAASANRDVLNVRITTSFARADGTTAQPGDPLLKHRFPLGRLAGLGPNGVVTTINSTLVNGVLAPASAVTIQRDFGLVWSTDHWNYCGPSGTAVQSSIALLGAIGNREPNFFELLKAGILSGSLGRDAGTTGTYYIDYEAGPASGVSTEDRNADFQIIRIGANIIDQSDADSYPTEIRFNDANTAFYGIENLPYLERVFAKTLSPDKDSSGQNVLGQIGGWYMAEIWNPHQDAGYTAASTPTEFRFRGEGLVHMYHNLDVGSSKDLKNSGSVDFTTATANFREPTCLSNDPGLVRSSDCTPVDGTNGTNNPYPNRLIIGLRAGSVPNVQDDFGGIAPEGCDLVLEYRAPNGSYRTYSRMKNLIGTVPGGANEVTFYYQRADPRTDRFGTSVGKWSYATPDDNQPGGSLRKDDSPGRVAYDYFPRPFPDPTPPPPEPPPTKPSFIYQDNPNNASSQIFNNFYMGTLSDNVIGSNPRYLDRDGVLRSAEGAYYQSGNDGRPIIPSNAPSRPIILNRPFQNVGELGYAYRDLPWKNIDFFTANSGDAGLLDLFSVQETTTENALVAGRINLNTRQAPVLQAVVAGAMQNEVASLIIDNVDAFTVATGLVALTTGTGVDQGPLLNRSDLVTKASAILKGRATADQQIKSRREAALRALAQVGGTRIWNLMIDVIAQTGQFPPGANDIKNFVVNGEKRYWVYVAIDRYTGEVIDRVIEPVYE